MQKLIPKTHQNYKQFACLEPSVADNWEEENIATYLIDTNCLQDVDEELLEDLPHQNVEPFHLWDPSQYQ